MALTLDPITRIEGHLAIEVSPSTGTVTDVKSKGKMFRGFELILINRNPRDACIITQRICGV
jgi:hydrogenase large subunit